MSRKTLFKQAVALLMLLCALTGCSMVGSWLLPYEEESLCELGYDEGYCGNTVAVYEYLRSHPDKDAGRYEVYKLSPEGMHPVKRCRSCCGTEGQGREQ